LISGLSPGNTSTRSLSNRKALFERPSLATMGCAASVPADEEKFLTSHKEYVKNCLASQLVSPSITKVCLKKDWKALVEETGEYIIKTTDGTDFLKLKENQGQTVICDMKGDVLSVLQEELQDDHIIGCECVQQVKFLYAFAPKPFNPKNTVTSQAVVDGKPLYHWLRVHAEPTLVGKSTQFKITYATGDMTIRNHYNASEPKPLMDMFTAETYTAKVRKDGRFTLKDCRSRGAVSMDFCESESETVTVSIAPDLDAVALVSATLQVLQLVTKLNGNIAYWSSTASTGSSTKS
jgi:hypothetical protein